MYISYSGWKQYRECPFAYWHNYVNKTPLEKVDDRLGSVFGSAVGVLFEDFYTQKIWKEKHPKKVLLSRVEEVTKKVLRDETREKWGRPGGVLLWRGSGDCQNPRGMYANSDELMDDVREAVHRGLEIIKHYRLLGPRAEAEVKLDCTIEGHRLGGRADFIIRRLKPHRDLGIYDGKGSRHRGKYVSPKQLLWYAMLYRQKFDHIPDKLAFVYWRYPPPKSIDWVGCSGPDLDELRDDVLQDVGDIDRHRCQLQDMGNLTQEALQSQARSLFKPKASEGTCRFCSYAVANQCSWGAGVVRKMEQRWK